MAKKVLEGKTTGYRNHPQLHRFKKAKRPVEAINQYLCEVYSESVRRNYRFDKEKINWHYKNSRLPVTHEEIESEAKHLLNKLKKRDIIKYKELKSKSTYDPHPLFFLRNEDVDK